FLVSEIATSQILDHFVQNFPDFNGRRIDKFWKLIEDATSVAVEPHEIAFAAAERLYLMGAIGIKYDPNLPYQYFYQTQKLVGAGLLTLGSKIRIHKMLHSSLRVIR
ncbi:MAG: hypothetical protein ACC619_05740, partial [Paracoccaceae bacterium]